MVVVVSSSSQNDPLPDEQRRDLMNKHNPKYVLRNWMSVLAYERSYLFPSFTFLTLPSSSLLLLFRAEKDDYSVLYELLQVLSKPYEEQSEEIEKKYYQKTPSWAKQLPGVTFMS
jgi:uncharacterized protein YdiU (UPF0061 family)